MTAISDYAEAFGKLQIAGAKADEALKLWKAVPDQGSDLAKSFKQAYEVAREEFNTARAGLDNFQTRFFNSLIVKTREGLRSAQTLDFESFGKVLSSGSDKVAYYIEKTTGKWKLIGETITTDGAGLLKGYAKLAEAGTFGKEVAKEVSDAMGALQEAIKSGENIHTAIGNLSDAVKDSFADFQKGAVIYDVADDVYYAGDYAAKQVNKAAAAIDESFESFGKKLLKFNIASYSIFDIADIVITGIRQSARDIKNENLAGLYVESLLSDEVTDLIKAAGLNTGELVADNIYEGAAQAVGQSLVVNGLINALTMAISSVVGGIPGLIIGGLSSVATSLGMDTLLGTDESSKAVNTWSSLLAGREHGGIFGLGAAEPYDTTEFERLLRESGKYTEQEITDLVVAARITDTATLLDAIKANNGGIVSAADLAKVAELASTNSIYQAFQFATSTPTDNLRGNTAYQNILYGSGYTKDMYVGRTGQGYGFADWFDTDIGRSLNSLSMTQGNEAMAAVRVAAAMGAVGATSIAQAHQGQNGVGSWVSSEMVLPLESAAADLETIKKILGEDYAGLQLGEQIAVNGKEYIRVLDATGKAVSYFGDDTESLRTMIQAMYVGGAQEGDFTEALRGIIDGNDYLKQALVDTMGYDARAIAAYDNIPSYLALLAESDSSYREITGYTLDENPGMAAALMKQQLDIWGTYEAAKLAEQDVYTRTSGLVGGNSDIWQGNTAQAIIGATLDGLLPTMLAQLAESGLVFSSGQQSYDSAFQEGAVLDYITVGTVKESLMEAFRGATIDLHGLTANLDDDTTFNLGDLQVTTAEAKILAEAGIQLNSNGTITMMYSNNGDVTGNKRRLSLGQDEFSQDFIDAFGTYDITLDFENGEIDFGNFDELKGKMTSAMFKLSDDINNKLTDPMREVFATVGKVTDDGFLEITNSSILSGNTAMTAILDGLDWTGVSDVVKDQLYNVAELVDQGGRSIQDNIIEWANAIRVPSPVAKVDIADDVETYFREFGTAFETQYETIEDEIVEKTSMIISNTGERLHNGVVLISADKWNSLSAEVRAALELLDVEVTSSGNQVIVDLSHIMEDGADHVIEVFVDQPELWEQIPETFRQYLEEGGIVAYNGVLGIKRNIESGLVELTDGWLLELDNFNEETRQALEGKLHVTLESGLVALNGYIEGADIPETVNKEALVPFQELPQEIQDALSQVDENCAQKMYDIKDTASAGFTNLSSALEEIAGGVAGTADEMVTSITNAVTRAMTSMQQLEKLQANAGRSGGGFLGIGSTKNNVVYKGTDKQGNSYYGEYSSNGRLVKYIRIDGITGREEPVSNLPEFAAGGAVDPVASSLPILAGELGKEMAIMPNGDTKLLDAGLYNLPAGTQILNADDTKTVQKYAGSRPSIKAFANGTTTLSMSTAEGYEYSEYDTRLIDYLQADSNLREARGNERSSQLQYFLAEAFELLFARIDLLRGTFDESAEHMSILLQDAIGAVGDSISSIGTQLTTSLLPSGDGEPAAESFLGYDWMAVVEAAKVGWANAATDEEREAWHNLAEMARATQGFSGGADGSGHTDLVAPRGSIEETVRSMLELMTTNYASAEGYTWANVVQAAQEGYKNAVSDEEREAWHTVAEMARATQGFSGGVDGSSYELLSDEQAQTASLEQAVQMLQALQMWSAEPIETVDGLSWQDVVAMAKLGWSVATTDEERSLWHDLAEEARATQGFIGGPAGNAVIYLGSIQGSLVTVVEKLQALQAQFNTVNWGSVKGSARGSIINSEGLYKLGEGGLSEAIIPLERPDVLNKVGAALSSFMPESAQGLRAALGVANGGITVPGTRSSQFTDPATMVDTITRGVLERVLPAVATAQASDESSRTPVYVGTLIADDAGLRNLERKLYTIRQAESMRRG